MTDVITFKDKERCEILTKVADPVPHGESCRDLIEAMHEAMQYPKGIGLAAPQIGENKRVIVINVPNVKNGQRIAGSTKAAIINPEMTWYKGAKIMKFESCLSYPDVLVEIPRFQRVKFTGFDVRWNPITIGGKNLVARVLQHELDHLNGRTLAYYAKMAEEVAKEAEAKENEKQ